MATETPVDSGDASGATFVDVLRRFYPEPLVFASLLGVAALVATTGSLTPLRQIELFATGFFELFAVQMSLILLWVLSGTVVESPLTGRFLDGVVDSLPVSSQSGLIYATGVVAMVFGLLNWALGLIGGVLVGHRLCRRAEQRGTPVHYPAVLTAGLLSLVVMNQGLSSAGALLMADASGTTNFLVDPDQGQPMVKFGAFLFHPVNAVSAVLFVVTLPLLLTWLAPDDEARRRPISEFTAIGDQPLAERFDHYAVPPREEWTIADRLEQSSAISVAAFLIGGSSIVAYFATGGQFSLLWLLFALMMLGLLLQVRPMAFVDKTKDSTKWATHVAIPFLLYANVHVLVREADLYGAIGEGFAATGVPHVVSYLVALVVGLLVPDPGSVWVIEGPALAAVDADLATSIVSVMYGAGVSNLWTSFVFLGIIGSVTGFAWREFFRYAGAVTAYVSVVLVVLLLVL